MLLFKKIPALQSRLRKMKQVGMRIGYVPTMGALHDGHASLVRRAKGENDLVACSIFVNPTQFNDPSDLEKYPRTEGRDIETLTHLENDLLFYPRAEDIYPKGLHIPSFDFGQVDKVMEGKFRPGHFEGVVEVVYRLLDIVKPDRLYMGQKDFQQLTIIQHMLQQIEAATELIACPIIREPDGLALSSRNIQLKLEHRKNAPVIYQTLSGLSSWIKQKLSIREMETKAVRQLSNFSGFKPEYFEIVDGYTLQAIDSLEDTDYAVACTAVWVGSTRLIDNIILKGPKN